MEPDIVLQTLVNAVMLVAIYSLMASGMTLMYGIMHLLNFAHGEVYMVGGYFLFTFVVTTNLPYEISFPLGILVVAAMGFVAYWLLFSRIGMGFEALLKGLILSLGLSMVLQNGVARIWGISEMRPPTIFPGVASFLGASIAVERVVVMIIAGAVMAGLYLFIKRIKYGQAMIAVEQDSEAASLQGVSTWGICALCVTLGFALAAMAGGLMAPITFISPGIGLPVILRALVIIILGGMGSITGAILAAGIIGFVDSFATQLFDIYTATILVFAILILVILFRPQGLMGHA